MPMVTRTGSPTPRASALFAASKEEAWPSLPDNAFDDGDVRVVPVDSSGDGRVDTVVVGIDTTGDKRVDTVLSPPSAEPISLKRMPKLMR